MIVVSELYVKSPRIIRRRCHAEFRFFEKFELTSRTTLLYDLEILRFDIRSNFPIKANGFYS